MHFDTLKINEKVNMSEKKFPFIRVCGEPERYPTNTVFSFENENSEEVGRANVWHSKTLHCIKVGVDFRRKGYGFAIINMFVSDGVPMYVKSIGAAVPFWKAAQKRFGDLIEIDWP